MQEIFINCNEMKWVKSVNYPKGTISKVLRDYEEKKTTLLKVPAGFIMDAILIL